MIAEGCICLHLHDVGMAVQQVTPQPMQVVCSKYLYVAWLLLIQHPHCRAWFGPRWWVATLVARLGLAWAGSIPAAALQLR